MKPLFIVGTIAATSLLSSCINPVSVIRDNVSVDNGPMKLLAISTKDFNEIESRNLFDIHYTQGPTKVELSVPEKYADQVHVYVNKEKLSIGFIESNTVKNLFKVTATVSSPTLKGAYSMGIGNIFLEGSLRTGSLKVETTGTGYCKLDTVIGTNIILETYGTGDIDFKSITASRIHLESDGTGDINGKNVDTNSIILETSGTGDIKVAGKAVTASVSSSGIGSVNIKKLKTNTTYED